ncbi:MAG: methionyl-tRNA formyltransferase [Bacilli bacterium]|nr:methionyl-tRNA formyltransferase [Bacilli bacterium]
MDLDKVNIEKELKIVFMGTPEFAVPILEGLISKYKIRAVVTQPDHENKKGMGMPPIKELALKHTILVLQPQKISEEIDSILALEPDLIITCAYGQKLPKELLDYPRIGCINVHASLLPKLRGGAPIHRAIMEGYSKTGVTIMHMSEEMDKGDIIVQRQTDISQVDTASSLHDKLNILGRDLLLEVLPSIIDGTAKRFKQDSTNATYAFTIKREDERIDFSKTKRQIYNKVRGLNAWPGAYCLVEGKILKVWNCYESNNYFPELFDGQITAIYKDGFGIKVSNGELVFTVVQLEGKKKMNANDFINGLKDKNHFIGKILD